MVNGVPTRATEGGEQPSSPDGETSHTCAMINAVEMNHTCWHLVNRGKELLIGSQEHTPKRVAWDGLSSRNLSSRSTGDHTGSPKMTWDEELTMIPMKLTMENVNGTARSCGRPAANGFFARDAKSGALLRHQDRVSKPSQEGRTCSRDGAYVTSVAILLMQDMRLTIIAQLRSLPCNVEG